MANIPATKGKFGNHEYYALKMKAKQVVERFIIPSEVPGWEKQSIEERFQREINMSRVKNHIAPYLIKNPNRFFGAFICIIDGADKDFWVPFSKVADYKNESLKHALDFDLENIGYVRMMGNEAIIPIDGQHRFAALKMAIHGKDDKGRRLKDGENLDVLSDDCMVIIIKNNHPKQLRQIFNKVNRYAKPTGKTDNIATSDDDAYAICTRKVCPILTDKLVKFGTTLAKGDFEFTLLNTVYSINEAILSYAFPDVKISKSMRPNEDQLELYVKTCEKYWENFVSKINIWKDALKDPENKDGKGDDNRKSMREIYLILKPVIQVVLIKAFFRVKLKRPGQSVVLSDTEVFNRINDIDWSYDNPLWKYVLYKEGGLIIDKDYIPRAIKVVSYHLGEKLSPDELKELKDVFKDKTGRTLENPMN